MGKFHSHWQFFYCHFRLLYDQIDLFWFYWLLTLLLYPFSLLCWKLKWLLIFAYFGSLDCLHFCCIPSVCYVEIWNDWLSLPILVLLIAYTFAVSLQSAMLKFEMIDYPCLFDFVWRCIFAFTLTGRDQSILIALIAY